MQFSMAARARASGILFALLAPAAWADDPPAPQPPSPIAPETPVHPPRGARHATAQELIDQRLGSLAKALSLNPDQQRRVRAILVDQRKQMLKVLGEASLAGGDRVGAVRAVNEETAERIRDVLDDDQKKKYNPAPPGVRPRVEPARAEVSPGS